MSGNWFNRIYHDVKGDYGQDEINRNRASGGGFGSNFFEKLANHAGDLGVRGAKYIPALIGAGASGIFSGGGVESAGTVDPSTSDLGGFGFGGGEFGSGELNPGDTLTGTVSQTPMSMPNMGGGGNNNNAWNNYQQMKMSRMVRALQDPNYQLYGQTDTNNARGY